ncbi:hypothetical protein BDQ17DRAFT_1492333 [Cyathus striatus]|nr:hypothetical protein BDQ17DRAFT_1492333 [Cyathus striatus]
MSPSNSDEKVLSGVVKPRLHLLSQSSSEEHHPKKPKPHSKAVVVSNSPTSLTKDSIPQADETGSSSPVENPNNENSSSQAQAAVVNDTGSLIPSSDNYPNSSAQEDDKIHLSNIIRVRYFMLRPSSYAQQPTKQRKSRLNSESAATELKTPALLAEVDLPSNTTCLDVPQESTVSTSKVNPDVPSVVLNEKSSSSPAENTCDDAVNTSSDQTPLQALHAPQMTTVVHDASSSLFSSLEAQAAVSDDKGAIVSSDNYANDSAQEDNKIHLSNIIRARYFMLRPSCPAASQESANSTSKVDLDVPPIFSNETASPSSRKKPEEVLPSNSTCPDAPQVPAESTSKVDPDTVPPVVANEKSSSSPAKNPSDDAVNTSSDQTPLQALQMTTAVHDASSCNEKPVLSAVVKHQLCLLAQCSSEEHQILKILRHTRSARQLFFRIFHLADQRYFFISSGSTPHTQHPVHSTTYSVPQASDTDYSSDSSVTMSSGNSSNQDSSSQARIVVLDDAGSFVSSDNYTNGSAQEDDKIHLSNIIRTHLKNLQTLVQS